MDREKIKEKFLDLLEGSLSSEEAENLQNIIEQDPELKLAYKRYCALLTVENLMRKEGAEPSAKVKAAVMQAVSKQEHGVSNVVEWFMSGFNQRWIRVAVATCVVGGLSFMVVRTTRHEVPQEFGVISNELSNDADIGGREVTEKEDVPKVGSKDIQQTEEERAEGTFDQMVETIAKYEEADRQRPVNPNSPATVTRQNSVKTKNNNDSTSPIALSDLVAADNSVPEAGAALGEEPTIRVRRQEGGYAEYTMKRGKLVPKPYNPLEAEVDHFLGRVIDQNTERYNSVSTNQPILTREQPVSTFSIDVDTGSYTNARRYLQSGHLPPSEAIRLEEFINYFSYNYPVQYEKPFSVSYEVAPSPFRSGRHLLKIGVKAKDIKEATKPWNLVFLVDVSGSMDSPDKLPLVKQALKLLVNKMRPTDKVAIVTYAGDSSIALTPSSVSKKSEILAAIDGLSAGGSTYGEGGIRAAYNLAQQNFLPGGVNRVVLATDGDFNVGVTDQSELIRLIEEKRKANVTLTTVGVGQGNINEGLMEQLANKGNGNYFYMDSFKEARKVFEDDLFGTIEVIAKDVKIQVEFNPENTLEYRLLGYENRALKERDFNDDTVDAGEIGSGHTVTAIYEVVLKDSPIAGSIQGERRYGSKEKEEEVKKDRDAAHKGELAFVKIRYKAPEGSESSLLTYPVEDKEVKGSFENASDDFKFASSVAGFAELLSHSPYIGDASYQKILEIAGKALGEDKGSLRREFVELVRNARSIGG